MTTKPIFDAETIDSYCLSIQQLSACTLIEEKIIVKLVENEVLTPKVVQPDQWMFQPQDLSRLSRAGRLMVEFDLSPVALALVFDLLDELQRLRMRTAR